MIYPPNLGLSDEEKIIVERIKKAILGLSIREAKRVLCEVLDSLEDQVVSKTFSDQ